MKKFLLFLIILCIGSITLLITGCEKEKDVLKADQVVIDQANKGVVKYKKTINMYDGSKFDIIITDKGVIYPPITDEYFERLTSGYVTLPEDFVPSLKFKTIILEMLGDHEKRVMDLKGVHLYFDENLAKQYETDYGRTMVQSYYDYLISVGIDPSLPQEERDRLEHEIQKKRTVNWNFVLHPQMLYLLMFLTIMNLIL